MTTLLWIEISMIVSFVVVLGMITVAMIEWWNGDI
jgi:hypothetical protein